MQKRIIRVLIADSHHLFRRGAQSLFSAAGDLAVVAEAQNSVEAIWMAEDFQPDVVLLDGALPGLDCVETIDRIGKSSPSSRTLLLTVAADAELNRRAMDAGASDCLQKDTSPWDLVAKIREIAPTKECLAGSNCLLSEDLPEFSASESKASRSVYLTPRELEVLRLFADGGTAREIAEKLQLSVKTIEAHKFNFMRKLDIHTRAELVNYAQKQLVLS